MRSSHRSLYYYSVYTTCLQIDIFVSPCIQILVQNPSLSPVTQMESTTGRGSFAKEENKGAGVEKSRTVDEDGLPAHEGYEDVWADSTQDQRDMLRLGKTQDFKRSFHLLSVLGFVSVYMATWEFVLVSLSVGFTNGGFAGLFCSFITTVICYTTIVASLAESWYSSALQMYAS